MQGIALGEAGRDAMAQELLRIASDGQRTWDRETPKIRAEFRGFIDLMVGKASEAEEARQAKRTPPRSKGVLP
jgi:hypothetical protein